MRAELSRLLTRRYPELYGPVDRVCEFPFGHGDGWFAIIDALSETLVSNAEKKSRSPEPVGQVRVKLGTLSLDFRSNEADEGANVMAEEMSGRLCEVTGRPGRLGSRRGWRATRAPGLDGIEFDEPFVHDDGRMGTPPLGFTAAEMQAWRADVLTPEGQDSVLALPKGWLDLADCMLEKFSDRQAWSRKRPPEVGIRVSHLGVGPSGSMVVECAGGRAYVKGIVSMTVALSRRIDRVTGATEPNSGG